MSIIREKIFLPIKLGGFGFYSLHKTREASFCGSVTDVNNLIINYDDNIQMHTGI